MYQQRFVSWARWVDAMAIWTFDLASLLQRRVAAWQRATAQVEWQPGAPAAGWVALTRIWSGAVLAWPFDLARAQHAASVQAGLAERSLLGSADFEHRLDQLEGLTLGPWARRV